MRRLAEETELAILCDKYGSDKGSMLGYSNRYVHPSHTYIKIYASLFAPIKNDPIVLFECGIGTNNPNILSSMGVNGAPGASLRVWKDFFKNGLIYGADIDHEILFTEDRIITDQLDQTDKESVSKFWEHNDFYPDIIIDDGLHEYHAGISLYENSFERLKSGGLYIIEDILPEDVSKYKEYFDKTTIDVMFISLNRHNATWNDNTLMIIFKE